MPISRTDSRVQCPFYQYDESREKGGAHRIFCEGIVDRSNLVLTYRRKKDFRKQLNIFCCEHYRKCEVYRMLMEKYRDAA